MTENESGLETPVEQTETSRTVRKCLTLFGADADMWEADGMPREEIDALVLALWRWYRGRPETAGLSVAAKVLYSSITKRLEATEDVSAIRAVCGRRGGKKTQAQKRVTQANVQANAQAKFKQSLKGGAQAIASGPLLKPTSTSTSTPTSTTTTTTISDTHIQIHTGGTPPPTPCVCCFLLVCLFLSGVVRDGRDRPNNQDGHTQGGV